MESDTKQLLERLLNSVKNEFDNAHNSLTSSINRLNKALNRLESRDHLHVVDSIPDAEKLLQTSLTKLEQLQKEPSFEKLDLVTDQIETLKMLSILLKNLSKDIRVLGPATSSRQN